MMSKNVIKNTGLLFVIVFLTSCSTLNYVNIETLRPANVSLPPYVKSIVLANNTKPNTVYGQFNDLNSRLVEPFPVDSVVVGLISVLCDDIRTVNFFENVSLISQPAYFSEKENEEDIQTAISNIRYDYGAQAIIVLDTFYQKAKVVDRLIPDVANSVFDVSIHASYRVFLLGKTEPEIITVEDTISWDSYGYTSDESRSRLPRSTQWIPESLSYFSTRMVNRLLPHGEDVSRVWFTSWNPYMKDAEAYAMRNSWDEASYLWEYVYENTKKDKLKAKAAFNMALHAELTDNLPLAEKWCKLSIDLFSKEGEKYQEYIQLAKQYLRALENRLREEQILNKQLPS